MIIYILFLNLARFAIARIYGLSASVSLCVAFKKKSQKIALLPLTSKFGPQEVNSFS